MENISIENCTVVQDVKRALAEDIGQGDISAQIINPKQNAKAQVITREDGYFCGLPWVAEAFKQLNHDIKLNWHTQDGAQISANQTLFTLEGNARSLLTGERTALNFVQMLSAITTRARYFADLVKHTKVKILDTRKTMPGLRLAQKYAVSCGGCNNHRLGLYDAFLIKENHIASCGSVSIAINSAKQIAPNKKVEIEVENLSQLNEALIAGVDIILLDNFSINDMKAAVKINAGKAKLEVSGAVNESTIVAIAQTGVDFISIGALTKNIKALDLSMQFVS